MIEHDPDLRGGMVLPSQYTGKPVFSAILDAIAIQLQDLEDERRDLALASLLSKASGVFLENLESLVQAPHLSGLSEDERRAIVLATGLANRSHACPSDVQDMLTLLGLSFVADWFAQGAVTLAGPLPVWPAPWIMGSLIKMALAAGCQLRIYFTTGDPVADPGFREYLDLAWTAYQDATASRSGGVLRIEGIQGQFALGYTALVDGTAYRASFEARGTAPSLALVEGVTGAFISQVTLSTEWQAFSVDWVAGSGGAPVAVEGAEYWVEIRGLSVALVDPDGTRANQNATWADATDMPAEDLNGWGDASGSTDETDRLGGLLAHVQVTKL